jgi:probable rRNA maturation factor
MNVSIEVEDEGWRGLPSLEDDARAALTKALGMVDANAGDVEIALLFTSDDEIAALNRDWRGKSGATNVLSFPADEFPVPAGEPRPLGDIVLAFGTVAHEAAAQGKTLHGHTMHLIVHGFLHLLGHDHLEPGEAYVMESLECRILKELGISNPYE